MIGRETENRGNRSVADFIPKALSEHKGTLVRIVDFDPAKHLVKVVKISDNKPLSKDQELDNASQQKKKVSSNRRKSIKNITG